MKRSLVAFVPIDWFFIEIFRIVFDETRRHGIFDAIPLMKILKSTKLSLFCLQGSSCCLIKNK